MGVVGRRSRRRGGGGVVVEVEVQPVRGWTGQYEAFANKAVSKRCGQASPPAREIVRADSEGL